MWSNWKLSAHFYSPGGKHCPMDMAFSYYGASDISPLNLAEIMFLSCSTDVEQPISQHMVLAVKYTVAVKLIRVKFINNRQHIMYHLMPYVVGICLNHMWSTHIDSCYSSMWSRVTFFSYFCSTRDEQRNFSILNTSLPRNKVSKYDLIIY